MSDRIDDFPSVIRAIRIDIEPILAVGLPIDETTFKIAAIVEIHLAVTMWHTGFPFPEVVGLPVDNVVRLV